MPRPNALPWLIFAPWRYSSWWRRALGFFCLVAIVFNVAALFIPALLRFVLPVIILLGIAAVADYAHGYREYRKFKKTMKALRLWSKVIEGKIRDEDLTPEQREEIAVQRASAYIGRTDG
jgi:hypothetical protein